MPSSPPSWREPLLISVAYRFADQILMHEGYEFLIVTSEASDFDLSEAAAFSLLLVYIL